jgi:glycosyltransferase involved in cell wall biosynthesis
MAFGLSGENILCFAGEDWWYHHPHSKNHILKRLARENRVLFVNSISLGLPALSNPDFFLKIRRKLKSSLRWLKRVPEGLHVMTPFALPLYSSPRARALNARLVAWQIRAALRLCGMCDPVVWVAIPSAVDVVEQLRPKLVLYQVSDKYDSNEDSALAREIIRQFDRRLTNMAAVVMYSGRKLYEESEVASRIFLEQAVDFEHFATEAPEATPEVADLPAPVLGYLGGMDYVMDVPLIAEVARRRPDWHWLLVGWRSNLVRVSAPNVHFAGPKPYAELPRYIKKFDVCVLPWKQAHSFIEYGSAIKMREYLATGKPVVSSPLHEYRHTPGIRFYRTPDQFIAAVEDALTNDTAAERRARQAAVQHSTWDARAQQVGEMIHKLLAGRAPSTQPADTAPALIRANSAEPLTGE